MKRNVFSESLNTIGKTTKRLSYHASGTSARGNPFVSLLPEAFNAIHCVSHAVGRRNFFPWIAKCVIRSRAHHLTVQVAPREPATVCAQPESGRPIFEDNSVGNIESDACGERGCSVLSTGWATRKPQAVEHPENITTSTTRHSDGAFQDEIWPWIVGLHHSVSRKTWARAYRIHSCAKKVALKQTNRPLTLLTTVVVASPKILWSCSCPSSISVKKKHFNSPRNA